MVVYLRLAQDDANQIVGAGLIVAILHLRRDLVVGLGYDPGQINPGGVITQSSEGCDVRHSRKWELYKRQASVCGAARKSVARAQRNGTLSGLCDLRICRPVKTLKRRGRGEKPGSSRRKSGPGTGSAGFNRDLTSGFREDD